MRDYCFFSNVYIRVEMLEEWKNSIVIPIYVEDRRQIKGGKL